MLPSQFLAALLALCLLEQKLNVLCFHYPQRACRFTLTSTANNDQDSKSSTSGRGFGPKKQPAKYVEKIVPNQSIAINETITTSSSNTSDLDTTTAIFSTSMYQKRAAQEEAKLLEMQEQLREEEDLLAQDPSVGAVPELVANRMIGRIAVFFGVPVFGGMAIFVGSFFASKYYDLVIPPVVVAYATQVPFVLGLVGISYGILSSSWDEVLRIIIISVMFIVVKSHQILTVLTLRLHVTGGW